MADIWKADGTDIFKMNYWIAMSKSVKIFWRIFLGGFDETKEFKEKQDAFLETEF